MRHLIPSVRLVAVTRPRMFVLLAGCTLVLSAVPVGAQVWASGTQSDATSVHVQRKLSIRENVHISFLSHGRLPEGGYYYAVIVLKPYRGYTRSHPPPCSTSSDMERTDYGYPRPDHSVQLALTPAQSSTGHWCRGGAYVGAVYAVLHAPPCESKYPCRSEPYKAPSPCWEVEGGRKVCGVVALPKRYAYPESLPAPLASGARIVGRFNVVFK
jgi:hypothetical protein